MSSGGHNIRNLSTSRFNKIDSFELIHKYQTENAIVLKINDTSRIVNLSKISNNYGGYDRIYFNCPRCNSRVRLLYITKESLFCRNCCRLSYPIQRSGNISKVFYRLAPLFRRLKASTNNEYMINNIPPRPRYMRHATYKNLIDHIQEMQNHHWAQFIGWAHKFINNRQMQTKRKGF